MTFDRRRDAQAQAEVGDQVVDGHSEGMAPPMASPMTLPRRLARVCALSAGSSLGKKSGALKICGLLDADGVEDRHQVAVRVHIQVDRHVEVELSREAADVAVVAPDVEVDDQLRQTQPAAADPRPGRCRCPRWLSAGPGAGAPGPRAACCAAKPCPSPKE